jgi:hypothetical protein
LRSTTQGCVLTHIEGWRLRNRVGSHFAGDSCARRRIGAAPRLHGCRASASVGTQRHCVLGQWGSQASARQLGRSHDDNGRLSQGGGLTTDTTFQFTHFASCPCLSVPLPACLPSAPVDEAASSLALHASMSGSWAPSCLLR